MSAKPTVAQIGHIIGNRYRITSELPGENSLWAYKASDREHEGKFVRIEVLSSQWANRPAERQRFLSEARRQEMLLHDNIVEIYDVQEAESLVYVVMEYLQSETMWDMLERFRPPLGMDAIAQLSRPMFESIGYAHSVNTIHGNIHPGNILLGWLEEHPVLKVRGFGTPQGVDPNRLDQLKAAPFLPPEVVSHTSHVDHRADIYSLGACLYLIATGQPPFKGAYQQMMEDILTIDPIYPCEITSACPPVLADFIVKCMGKTPDARYQSCEHALAEIDRLSPYTSGRLQVDIVGLNPPPKPESQAEKVPFKVPQADKAPKARPRALKGAPPSDRPPWLIPLAVIAVLLLAAGGYWFLTRSSRKLCKDGESRPCYTGPEGTKGVGLCFEGKQTCSNGAFGGCVEQVIPTKELCNGKDDDCDGKIDNLPAFANIGKDCKTPEGACMTPGKYVCADDGKSLRCKAKRKPKNSSDTSQLTLLLVPEEEPLKIKWQGKTYKAKALFCLPRPKARRVYVTLQRKGYYTCRLRLKRRSWEKGTLTLELKRRKRGRYRMRRSYCMQ